MNIGFKIEMEFMMQKISPSNGCFPPTWIIFGSINNAAQRDKVTPNDLHGFCSKVFLDFIYLFFSVKMNFYAAYLGFMRPGHL